MSTGSNDSEESFESTETIQAQIMAARINKIPKFWPEAFEAVFTQIEALFRINNVTNDDTKFDYIVAHATSEMLPYITPVISENLPDGKTRYTAIKESLLQAFSTPIEVKLRKLFKGQMLGSDKPTQLLTKMKNVAGGECNDTVCVCDKKIFAVNTTSPYAVIFKQFPELTKTIIGVPTNNHSVEHHIIVRGHPIAERARRLTGVKLKAAKTEFDFMLKQGICSPSNSEWASPLHLVKKSDGSWRPCGDYRRLNSITVSDKYPIPHLQDSMYCAANCKIFSTLDLERAFHQIPLAVEDRAKSAVITPFGLFEFTVKFLGYMIDEHGIRPPDDRIRAIIDYPKPQTIDQIRRFLGVWNFYRNCLPNAAAILSPLYALTLDAKKKDRRPVNWTPSSEKAFDEAKLKMREAVQIALPVANVPLVLTCDASNA